MEKNLEEILKELKQPHKVDSVIDNLAKLLNQNDLIYISCQNNNLRVELAECMRTVSFGDCVGRFRTLLARLCVRVQENCPQFFEGGLYGFKAHVNFTFMGSDFGELIIETSNTRTDSHLLIRKAIPD